ncbi:hypothetical protein M1M96_01780 [Peptococcaceae bacterium]|nr:hypothetical protein [Peptococcaceae bacterium]
MLTIIHFSEEGQKELSMMADKIKQMIHVVNAALVTNSCYLAEKAKKMYEEIEELEFRIRMSHFARLKEGIKSTGNVTPCIFGYNKFLFENCRTFKGHSCFAYR